MLPVYAGGVADAVLLTTAAGAGAAQPWRLRTAVVHQWRAFPERLRALAASEDELTIVTAGRGTLAGADAEVLRCWILADGSAGASSVCPGPEPEEISTRSVSHQSS